MQAIATIIGHLSFEKREDLQAFLTRRGVSWQTWGTEKSRPFESLWKNLSENQVTFRGDSSLPIIDVNVGVVMVYYQDGTQWKELFEEAQLIRSTGNLIVREFQGIAETLRKREFAYGAAVRCLREELGFHDQTKYRLTELRRTETRSPCDSEKWPGLKAAYRRSIFDCVISEEIYDATGYEEESDDIINYFIWRNIQNPPAWWELEQKKIRERSTRRD